jgi:hypothetical protein
MDLKLDQEDLKARIYHGLKSLQTSGDVLEPRYLEKIVCESFGMKHTGDGNFYADGVKNNVQASIKTRNLKPEIKKRVKSKDFQTHPDKFLGYSHNKKQKLTWCGLEFIQRRMAFPNLNDLEAAPELIGELCFRGFRENILQSMNKFKTDKVYEILLVHGYDITEKNYIVSVFWDQYREPDFKTITWNQTKDGVIGLQQHLINNQIQDVIICKRVNGNERRAATNYIEYKNPAKYTYSSNIKVPIPEPWLFDKEKVLEEINQKEKNNAYTLFFG